MTLTENLWKIHELYNYYDPCPFSLTDEWIKNEIFYNTVQIKFFIKQLKLQDIVEIRDECLVERQVNFYWRLRAVKHCNDIITERRKETIYNILN